MRAMILAAGRGTRMGELTNRRPKPMLPLAGMPVIEYHVRALAAAGFDELVINTAWLGGQISAALGSGERFGLNIVYSEEPDGALETAGGIAHALPLLGDAPFAVINGDIWTDYPFYQLKTALAEDDLAHLVMVPNPDHNTKGDFVLNRSINQRSERFSRLVAPKQVTSIVSDEKTNRPNKRSDKEAERTTATFSGIGVYRPQAFAAIQGRAPLAPWLHEWIATDQVSAQMHHGYWWDIGTPQRLDQVERFLLNSGS